MQPKLLANHCEDAVRMREWQIGELHAAVAKPNPEEPERIIKNMRQMCKEIFIHEWLDTPKSSGHIQTITEIQLNKWLGGYGKIGHEMWTEEIITPYYAGKFIGGLH